MSSHIEQIVEIPGKFGFGTMSLTWTPKPKPIDEQINILKFVSDYGIKFLNGGEFYGENDVNLKLFQKFLAGNTPEVNRQLVVSIKGGFGPTGPDGSKEGVSRSIDNILSYFPADIKNRPKLIFEMARVDVKVPYEQTLGYINEYVKSGKLDGISLSEVGVGSIQKAISIASISCVELELSLFTQDILNNGILQILSEHNITVIAYSPLARGLLTDYTVENPDTFLDNVPDGDFKKSTGRFQPDNFKHNLHLLKLLYNFAHDVKKVSLESLALSWIVSLSQRKNFRNFKQVSKIVPIPSGSTPEKITKNLSNIVELTDDDLKTIDDFCTQHPVKGLRYDENHEKLLNL
jgi:pyridoxine 4-dehydrogenase